MPAVSQEEIAALAERGYLTVTEAMKISKRSRMCINRWIRSGLLRAERVGHMWYVERSSLLRAVGPLAKPPPQR